jgi:hypothetical protein
MIEDKKDPQIEKDKHPIYYFVLMKYSCPYCNQRLKLIDYLKTESGKGSTYHICIKCERIFEKKYFPQSRGLGISIKQLTENQSKAIKSLKKRRIEFLKNVRR